MSGNGKAKARATATSPVMTVRSPLEFSFITATDPTHFKSKDNMKRVRKTAMHNYIDLAVNDPSCTDIRVTRRDPKSGGRSKTATLRSSRASARSKFTAIAGDSSSTNTTDQQSDDNTDSSGPGPASYPSPEASIAPSRIRSSSANDSIAATILFHRPSPNSISDSSLQTIKYTKSASNNRKDLPTGPPYGFYTATYGIRLKDIHHLTFARVAYLPDTDLDFASLKRICANYFGSKANAKQWMPLVLSSVPSFLAGLCISAPYCDLMQLASTREDPLSSLDTRQTLEVLSVVPKMIRESLSEAVHGNSDAMITAILNLLCAQMSSDDLAMVPQHQYYLNTMVRERGGLESLGGEGVLAIQVCISNRETDFLRNVPTELTYTEYSQSYRDQDQSSRFPSPESPLFCGRGDASMTSIADYKLCARTTLALIVATYQLTQRTIELGRLEQREDNILGPRPESSHQTFNKYTLQISIQRLIIEIHNALPARIPGHGGSNDMIYESVRLTALLYAHAINHRVPLHEACDITCMVGYERSKDVSVDYPFGLPHHSRCEATPELIQQAVHKTDLDNAWGRMAGVLYWITMVTGAACYSTEDLGSSRSESPAEHEAYRPPDWSTTYNDEQGMASDIDTYRNPRNVYDDHAVSSLGTIANWQSVDSGASAGVSMHSHAGRLLQEYVAFNASDMSTSSESLADAHQTFTPSPPSNLYEQASSSRFETTSGELPAVFDDSNFLPLSSEYNSPSTFTSNTTDPVNYKVRTVSAPSVLDSSTAFLSHNTGLGFSEQMKATKRKLPYNRTKDEERVFVRKYIIANAVRVSILLRFEHTSAMVEAITRLGDVQAFLRRGAGSSPL